MTPQPVALGLNLCEKVIVEKGTNNVTLVSNFTKLIVEEFPSPPQRFAVYAALTDGLGDATINLVVTHLDTDEVINTYRASVHFPDRLFEVRVLFRLSECSFPAPGRYQFSLLIDGEWIAHRQLEVFPRENGS